MIFVLVLTAVYIIYYAVIVTKDLYGKKDDAKTTEDSVLVETAMTHRWMRWQTMMWEKLRIS